jgi:eukaryotic-like serine/threonine-protein kinase
MAASAADRVVANRYALKTALGRSGMGVVWHAHDQVLGREVAVKEVVLPPLLPQAERRAAEARVLREVRAAARLNHPGAVALYDVVHEQDHTFVVMELVEARTLADLVQAEGPLPSGRVAEIGGQLADALEAAHRAGIVHRDVKPGNVMVAEDGGVKLADFGVASLQGDPRLTATGLVIGSPAYMAPEQARREPSGPPADLWALGATLFYAAEGEPPFDKGALIPTLAAVVNEDPRPMRRAGPLAPVIGALLAKDPAARPSAPKVRAWLAALVDMARPTPPPGVVLARGPGGPAPLPPAPARSIPEPAGTSVPPSATAAAGSSQRSREVPAFEPVSTPAREPTAGPARVGRPSRPVLPPAPPVRRRGGQRLVGALVLLLVGGVLVAWVTSSVGTGPQEERAAPATTSGGAGATGTTRPAASTTEQSATTQAPTTETTAAPHGGLPAGWRAFTNRAGSNRVGVPPGFRARTRQRYHATVVEEQRDPGRVFTVRSTTPANPLPQASRDYRAWARRNFDGYRELRYAEQQTYAGRTGAVVFEYQAIRDGQRVHVSHINVKGRTWGYNVEFITPVDQWASSQPLARQFEQAFRPLG